MKMILYITSVVLKTLNAKYKSYQFRKEKKKTVYSQEINTLTSDYMYLKWLWFIVRLIFFASILNWILKEISGGSN